MKVIGIDPSSTRTGYAVMTGPDLVYDAGYLTGDDPKAPAAARVVDMGRELHVLLLEHDDARVVIELPDRHVGRRHKGRGSGLANYGLAAGYLYAACQFGYFPRDIQTVLASVWTRGVPKRRRQAMVAILFPEYAAAMSADADGGGDVGDAIGLCQWWFANHGQT